MVTNVDVPAALQVLGFLGAVALSVVLLLVSAYGRATNRGWAGGTLIALAVLVALYAALLFGFSLASKEKTLAVGQEKYFCEIDCHLAYSVVGVREDSDTAGRLLTVQLRTRFDENTISPHRPKDAPLTPNPRQVRLVDNAGHAYAPELVAGTGLMQPLRPGEFYVTELGFRLPKDAAGLRIDVVSAGGPEMLLVGSESSVGHKRVYLGL